VYIQLPDLSSLKRNAFVTLTTPSFAMGAIVLGHTLRVHHGDSFELICLVTPDVNQTWRRILKQWWTVVEVHPYKPMKHFRRSWAKLALWNLTNFNKIIYLDSDMLVLGSIDGLFSYPQLSCVSDPNPPQICNTGLMVIEPNRVFFSKIDKLARIDQVRYAIGDQGSINAFFRDFTPLPPAYNAMRVESKSFARLMDTQSAKVIHFVCKKPWKCGRDQFCGCGHPYLNEQWWYTFDEACTNKTCMESWDEPKNDK